MEMNDQMQVASSNLAVDFFFYISFMGLYLCSMLIGGLEKGDAIQSYILNVAWAR